MHAFAGIFSNRCLLVAVTAWFIAQSLKIVMDGKFSWRRLFSAGGMPSSHSASVCALAVTVGASMGFDSANFAICFIFACIVMYDAAGVRRETGRQGKAINEILQEVLVEGQPITDDIMKEIVGHTPVEVCAGGLLGIAVGVVFILLFGV